MSSLESIVSGTMLAKQKTLGLLVLTFNTPYVVNDYFNHFVSVWRQGNLETSQEVADVFIHSHSGFLQKRHHRGNQ